MKKIRYEFCGISFCVHTPEPIAESAEAVRFRCNGTESRVNVILRKKGQLPEPTGMFCGRAGERTLWRQGETLYRRTQDLFRAEPHIEVSYQISDPCKIQGLIRSEDWPWATRTEYLWPGLALHQMLLYQRSMLMHASYVDIGGEGILFTGKSGQGKSTQAELWRRFRGAEILNGDKAGLSLRECPRVHGVPLSGTSRICKNRTLPLKAVVVLTKAPDNRVRRMGPSEAAAALCPNVFVDRLVPEEWALALNLLLDLSGQVPVYELACTPDERAVAALEKALNQA